MSERASSSGVEEMGKALIVHCMNADLKKIDVLLGSGVDGAVINFKNNVSIPFFVL